MSKEPTEQELVAAPTLLLLGDADGVLCTGDACVLPPPQPDDDTPLPSTT